VVLRFSQPFALKCSLIIAGYQGRIAMLSTSIVFVSRARDLYVTNRPDRRGGLELPEIMVKEATYWLSYKSRNIIL
jgi:hypothetical protein